MLETVKNVLPFFNTVQDNANEKQDYLKVIYEYISKINKVVDKKGSDKDILSFSTKTIDSAERMDECNIIIIIF